MNKMNFWRFLLFSAITCNSNFILTPKIGLSAKFTKDLSQEYNLQFLASIDSTNFYTAPKSNVLAFRNTLSMFFDIEEDSPVTMMNNYAEQIPMLLEYLDSSTSIPWHLDRIVKRDLPLNNSFPFSTCHLNENVIIDSYIVDTGIDVSQPQFGNRAKWGANFADKQNTDCNNHGTHVAGLIGSRDYGVCVDANLYAVKVLDCEGSGTLSGVIRGIEWSYKQHISKSKSSKKTIKSIINMSLGGGVSKAVNKAVESCLLNDNFYIVVAAGNENEDACNTSPASAHGALTVMASGIDDERAWFSNWGKCADIYSPGVNILSTIPNDNTAVYSGTSMATPIMVGALNHFIDMYPTLNMKDLKEKVLSESSKNKIIKNAKNTNNFLLYLYR